ncbi:serine hydrolase domain-containing protein [Streptomyces sp. B6B3]|uniref:serine hydrolase domain-containing protein n=1 Tax=Streptomyces sp. B6B3 TaxID=3153570 RepID=UPI00325E5BE8
MTRLSADFSDDFSAASDPDRTDAARPAPLLAGTARALLHRLATAQAEGRGPSMVAAVVRMGAPPRASGPGGGRRVWTASRGELPPDVPEADAAHVQYRIGSITKTLTAVAVMRLRDEGLLDLGDPLGAHLDAPHGSDATVAQLLAHSGGLASESRGPWWERTPGELRPELADIFGDAPRKHPAGRRHHYSNPGYALLGALVEKLRGEPWFDVLREEVLLPLGMDRTTAAPVAPHATGWAVHPYADARQPEPAVDTGRMAPAGQLWSTVADLSTFGAFLLAGDDAVLRAESLAEMRAPAVAPEAGDWDAAYGLGMQLARRDVGGERRLLSGHTGSMPGFLAGLWTSPADGLAAVAVANATSGPLAGTLAAELLAEVADREPALPETWRPMPASDAEPELLELTGTWFWGTFAYLLWLHAGRELTLGPAAGGVVRGTRFLPAPDGEGWLGQSGYYAGETLRAVRGPDGRVSHLDLGTFVFTRRPYDPDAPVPGGADPAGWTGAG